MPRPAYDLHAERAQQCTRPRGAPASIWSHPPGKRRTGVADSAGPSTSRKAAVQPITLPPVLGTGGHLRFTPTAEHTTGPTLQQHLRLTAIGEVGLLPEVASACGRLVRPRALHPRREGGHAPLDKITLATPVAIGRSVVQRRVY